MIDVPVWLVSILSVLGFIGLLHLIIYLILVINIIIGMYQLKIEEKKYYESEKNKCPYFINENGDIEQDN